jgi:WD40 repeat protein
MKTSCVPFSSLCWRLELTLAAMFSFGSVPPAIAQRVGEATEDDRQAIRRQIADLRKEIEGLRSQEEGLLKRIEQATAQVKRQEALLKRLEQTELRARTRALFRLEAPIYSLAISRDGRFLAAGTGGKSVHLWDLAAAREVRQLLTESRGIPVVVFSHDAKTLATGCIDGRITLWDVGTGKERRRLGEQASTSFALDFAPDGKTVASGDYTGGMLRLWDVASGEQLRSWYGHHHQITSIAFAPDGKTIASGSGQSDRVIRVWNAANGRKLREFASGDVMGLAFAADGKLASAAYYEKDVMLWDPTTGRGPRRFAGPGQGLTCVTFSADAGTLYSGSDRVVRVWEVRTGLERCRFEGHLAAIRAVASTPDGRVIASGDADGEVILWDALSPFKETKPAVRPLEALWEDLENHDAGGAYGAHWQFLAPGQPSIAFLGKRLQPVAAQNPKRVDELIMELDDDSPQKREQATKALASMGEVASSALRKAADNHPSLEVRRRAGRVLDALWQATPKGATLRALRAIEVLEHLGTPEARALLQRMADGEPMGRETQEARAALGRLCKKR